MNTNSNTSFKRISSSYLPSFLKRSIKQQRVCQHYNHQRRKLLRYSRLTRQNSSDFTVQPLVMHMFITVVNIQRCRQLVIMTVMTSFTILFRRRSTRVTRVQFILLPCKDIFHVIPMVLSRRTNRPGAMTFHRFNRIQPPSLQVRINSTRTMITFSMNNISTKSQK